MKTIPVDRAQLEQWLKAFKKIRDDKYSHWDVDEEISAIEKSLEPIAMEVMKTDEADFWKWWKPYQLKDCWRLEFVARDAWMAAKATQQKIEQHARNAITWTPETGYVFAKPEQEPVAKYCCHLCFNKSGQLFLDRMIFCPKCGNKRCPKATHHELPCTNSNEPNQTGSVYTIPPQRKPWVSLSDEDIERIAKKARSKDHAITLAMRELKEKNT